MENGMIPVSPLLINKYGLLTKWEVNMAGYWVFMDRDGVEVRKLAKNEANIQASWLNKLGQ